MRTFLLILTLFAFLQSAFLPVNLVLVALIARSLVIEDRDNYLLAFIGGLILSFLTQTNLGYYPLVFIVVVKIIYLMKKLPISFSPPMILFYGSLLIALVNLINSFFIGQNLEIYLHVVEAILILPIYFLTRLWEERFIVKKSMKLKM